MQVQIARDQITVTLSAKELLDIFNKSAMGNRYICHALFAHIKAEADGVENQFNKTWAIPFHDSYYKLSSYERNHNVANTFSMQMMRWIQSSNGFGIREIYEIVEDIPELMVEWAELTAERREFPERVIRQNLLERMINKGVPDLTITYQNPYQDDEC